MREFIALPGGKLKPATPVRRPLVDRWYEVRVPQYKSDSLIASHRTLAEAVETATTEHTGMAATSGTQIWKMTAIYLPFGWRLERVQRVSNWQTGECQ